MQTSSAPRYHALDSLRAVMMLLGIYLHVTVAYSNTGGWPYKQASLTGALNPTLDLIHIFRMPVFYVMAGFFGALLWERRGPWGFAANRVKRVLIPFVVGWAILFPAAIWLAGVGKLGVKATGELFASGGFLKYAHPMHLWFLEYLVLLYAIAALISPLLAAAVPQRVAVGADALFRRTVRSAAAPLVFAIPSFLALLPMKWAGLEDPPSFVPQARIVAAYMVPFAFGWLLYRNAGLLSVIRDRAWIHVGAALLPCALYIEVIPVALPPAMRFYAGRALHSLTLWLLIFGLTGLFLRYMDGHSARMRYLSDASYFLYLAHMPVILILQLAFERFPWHPLVKIPAVLAISVPVLLAMYHYGVRPTFVGAALNGRKYPIRRTDAVPVPA